MLVGVARVGLDNELRGRGVDETRGPAAGLLTLSSLVQEMGITDTGRRGNPD